LRPLAARDNAAVDFHPGALSLELDQLRLPELTIEQVSPAESFQGKSSAARSEFTPTKAQQLHHQNDDGYHGEVAQHDCQRQAAEFPIEIAAACAAFEVTRKSVLACATAAEIRGMLARFAAKLVVTFKAASSAARGGSETNNGFWDVTCWCFSTGYQFDQV
jgi:hypothetical protein